MPSGKSKSIEFPNGKRRVVYGKVLAPKSMRRKGKRFWEELTDEEKQKYDS